MKKWQIIAPVGAAALAAVAVIAMSKKSESKPHSAKTADKPKSAPAVKNAKAGTYSFVSGYTDAVTVELELKYDADRFSFAVIADEFPSYSSDSHVAVIYGEDFDMQLEYASYYRGEGFEALAKNVEEKFKGFGTVTYGEHHGIKYIDGDNICLCIPVPDDKNSYVLVTLMKAKGNDDDFTVLPDYDDVAYIIGSFEFNTSK